MAESTIDKTKSTGRTARATGSRSVQKEIAGPVVWAIDPFEEDLERSRALVGAIELWRKKSEASVIPISILRTTDISWPVELVAPLNDRLLYIANNSIRPLLQKVAPAEFDEPRLILQEAGTRRHAVEALLKTAEDNKAGLIAVHAHHRKGFGRLGSFTEALIALSPIPVLVLPPEAAVPADVRKILFPTDFSEESREAFATAIEWSLEWDAGLVLEHALEMPQGLVIDGDWGLGISASMIEQYWDDTEKAQRERGREWAAEAKKKGVDCEFVISTSTGPVPQRILESTRSGDIDLVIVGTRVHSTSQVLLGSIAREVVMNAPRPVIVVREKDFEKQ